MEQKLMKLYNTLMLVETKGESTKIMGTCISYIEQMIKEEQEKSARNDNEKAE